MRSLRIAGIVGGLLLAGGAAPAFAHEPVPGYEPAAAGQCSAARLRVDLGRVDSGAGNRYAPLEFTNRSAIACTLSGRPELVLLSSFGAALPQRVTEAGGPSPVVTLEPGGTARAVLHWTVVESDCGEPAALRVTPPGGGPHTTIAFAVDRVCHIDVTPVT
ncbi:DUF4232 domain-containing protein [Nonomuraea sp. NPDC048916]|uniref:DUF4232 domain-containing protein n=1 Tax=Nonomuraea sp. NPDC048916 TaxID=3154232 RepID=UPI0033CD6D06